MKTICFPDNYNTYQRPKAELEALKIEIDDLSTSYNELQLYILRFREAVNAIEINCDAEQAEDVNWTKEGF